MVARGEPWDCPQQVAQLWIIARPCQFSLSKSQSYTTVPNTQAVALPVGVPDPRTQKQHIAARKFLRAIECFVLAASCENQCDLQEIVIVTIHVRLHIHQADVQWQACPDQMFIEFEPFHWHACIVPRFSNNVNIVLVFRQPQANAVALQRRRYGRLDMNAKQGMRAMNDLERFNAVMNDQTPDRVPNWEAGAWKQAIMRWESEGLPKGTYDGSWFEGQPTALGLDRREFIGFDNGLKPPFDSEILEEDEETMLVRDAMGAVRRTLKVGRIGNASMSMDTFVRHAVDGPETWVDIKRRMDANDPLRLQANWRQQIPRWQQRTCPLIFGPNTHTEGFYWFARTRMGTEHLSLAWYDQPDLMHEMMAFQADYLIESARPLLENIAVDYICLAEDLAMKTGPLLSPETYRTFILPQLRRVVDFYRSHGVKHICVDSDGNFEVLLPMMMDAGVDAIWPLERAAGMDPLALRRKFGRGLRLWGGVDKREIARDRDTMKKHLRALAPLVEEGRFIPTVDHTVPPDVSYGQFLDYLEAKSLLLQGRL